MDRLDGPLPVTVVLSHEEQMLLLANEMNDHPLWSSIARKIYDGYERARTDMRWAGDETVVDLADGHTLRSGVYDRETSQFTSGEYVRLCDPHGEELVYWDHTEWEIDSALVMGAIINAAAGLRLNFGSANPPREKP